VAQSSAAQLNQRHMKLTRHPEGAASALRRPTLERASGAAEK